MAYRLTKVLQLAQSIWPCFSKDTEESVHFVKYKRFKDDQELKEINKVERTGNEHGCVPEDTESKSNAQCHGLADANKITEWQAGWNVTNAIQVTNFEFHTVYKKLKILLLCVFISVSFSKVTLATL